MQFSICVRFPKDQKWFPQEIQKCLWAWECNWAWVKKWECGCWKSTLLGGCLLSLLNLLNLLSLLTPGNVINIQLLSYPRSCHWWALYPSLPFIGPCIKPSGQELGRLENVKGLLGTLIAGPGPPGDGHCPARVAKGTRQSSVKMPPQPGSQESVSCYQCQYHVSDVRCQSNVKCRMTNNKSQILGQVCRSREISVDLT